MSALCVTPVVLVQNPFVMNIHQLQCKRYCNRRFSNDRTLNTADYVEVRDSIDLRIKPCEFVVNNFAGLAMTHHKAPAVSCMDSDTEILTLQCTA